MKNMSSFECEKVASKLFDGIKKLEVNVKEIKQIIDGEIDKPAVNYWTVDKLKIAIRHIVSDVYKLYPNDNIVIENMKDDLGARIRRDYPYLQKPCIRNKTTVTKLIQDEYNISIKNWYLLNSLNKLYKLMKEGLPPARGFYRLDNHIKVIMQLVKYEFYYNDTFENYNIYEAFFISLKNLNLIQEKVEYKGIQQEIKFHSESYRLHELVKLFLGIRLKSK